MRKIFQLFWQLFLLFENALERIYIKGSRHVEMCVVHTSCVARRYHALLCVANISEIISSILGVKYHLSLNIEISIIYLLSLYTGEEVTAHARKKHLAATYESMKAHFKIFRRENHFRHI